MLIISGIVVLLIAGVLFFTAFDQKSKLAEMQDTETHSVEFLQQLRDKLRTETGDSHFSYRTEVKGTVVCEPPLLGELSQVACVYYDATVTREYEEHYQETNNGKTEAKTRNGSETVFEQKKHTAFYVDDGTGKILIEPDGAEWESEQSLSRLESTGLNAVLRVGNFELRPESSGFGGFSVSASPSRRTKAYRFQEQAVPVGKKIYILGTASADAGELSIKKSGKSRFLISLKSEEELHASAGSTKRWLLGGAWFCAVSGTALLGWGML